MEVVDAVLCETDGVVVEDVVDVDANERHHVKLHNVLRGQHSAEA